MNLKIHVQLKGTCRTLIIVFTILPLESSWPSFTSSSFFYPLFAKKNLSILFNSEKRVMKTKRWLKRWRMFVLVDLKFGVFWLWI